MYEKKILSTYMLEKFFVRVCDPQNICLLNYVCQFVLNRCLDMVSSDFLRLILTVILKKCPHTFIHDWNIIHGAIEIRLFASTANNLISIGLFIRFLNIIASKCAGSRGGGGGGSEGGYGGP